MTEPLSTWLDFLKQHGAQCSAPEEKGIDAFAGQPAQGDLPDNFIAPLTDLGLISASGEDAATFLHNQVSNDVEHLGQSEARLAAYCSPKGRMLASFLIWKTNGEIMLQLPRSIQAPIQKRLQMYVLRSKAKLADVTSSHVLLGLAGPAAQKALASRFDALPEAAYGKTDSSHGTLIRLPDAGNAPRYQWITTNQLAQEAWPELTKTLAPVGTAYWRTGNIRAGIPFITQATQEQFVPQMLNFEVIGGVNFKKGCYPGQEIVARTQYLGKLKRRTLLASIPTENAKPGMEVFSSKDPTQPCGMIVNAEQLGPDRVECLVEIKTAALEEGSVHLGKADGPALSFHSLPYSLNEPTQP